MIKQQINLHHFQNTHNNRHKFNIVIGPVRCGKSTYIHHTCKPGDIRVSNRLRSKSVIDYYIDKKHYLTHDLWMEVDDSIYLNQYMYDRLMLLYDVIIHEFTPSGLVNIFEYNTSGGNHINTVNYREYINDITNY